MTSGRRASRVVRAAPDLGAHAACGRWSRWSPGPGCGTWRPASAMARRQPMMAALAWRRSWTVSMTKRSTPPVEEPGGRLLVAVALLGEGDLARGRRSWCPGRASRPPSDRRRPAGVTSRAMRADLAASSRVRCGQAVLGQHPGQRPEAVGLHHVAADVEEGPVQVGDHVRPGVDQDLVAALEGGAAEIVRARGGAAAGWCRWRRRR